MTDQGHLFNEVIPGQPMTPDQPTTPDLIEVLTKRSVDHVDIGVGMSRVLAEDEIDLGTITVTVAVRIPTKMLIGYHEGQPTVYLNLVEDGDSLKTVGVA